MTGWVDEPVRHQHDRDQLVDDEVTQAMWVSRSSWRPDNTAKTTPVMAM